MSSSFPITALDRVLRSVESVRNLRALSVLLGTFAGAGLLLAMAEASLARNAWVWGPLQIGASLFVAFYGGNAAGLLVMDEACGRAVRDPVQAVRDALLTAHRLVLALLCVALAIASFGAVLCGLLWLCRVAVAGPLLGPILFGLLLPLGVLSVGLVLLSLAAVVVPLAAPAIWSGAGVMGTLSLLVHLVRRRLLAVTLLMAVVSVLSAGVGAVATFVVVGGGRVVAELAVLVTGIDVPPQQLMAGLFGYGLRSLGGAAAVPAGSGGHAAAALVGGGVVFALALVTPGLVYLRGACSVYLAMRDEAP